MAITVETRTKIVELTVGMVGAAPGAAILSELAEVVDAGLSLNNLAIAIANNPAFKTIYPSFLTNTEFATNFLTALLGAEVSATTKQSSIDAMVADLNTGSHRGAAMYKAITTLSATASTDANLGAAKTALANKTAVAVEYSVTTQQSSNNLDTLKAVVGTVTSSAASLAAGLAAVNGTANPGATYNFTTSIDNLKGGGGNDFFIGDAKTLSATDTIDGGAGTDTLSYTDDSSTGQGINANVTGVEIINVRNINGTPAVTAVTEKQTVIITGAATGAVSFLGVAIAGSAGADTAAVTATKLVADAAAIKAGATAIGLGITDITAGGAGEVVITFGGTAGKGDVAALATAASGGATFSTGIETTKGVAAVAGGGIVDTINASGFVGATEFNATLSSSPITFSSLASTHKVSVVGNGNLTNGAVIVDATSSTTNIPVTLTGGTRSGDLQIVDGTSPSITSVNGSGTTPTNTVGTLAVNASAASLTITATHGFSATSLTGMGSATNAKITATGAGSVAFSSAVAVPQAIPATVTTVDASGLGGGITLATSNGAATIIGGQGADTIQSAGDVFLTTGTINAGAGADSLRLTTDVTALAQGNKYLGFETLRVPAASTQNMDLLATNNTFSSIQLQGAAALTNVSAAAAAAIVSLAGGTVNLGIKGALNPGQIDTVNLIVTNGLTSVATHTYTSLNLAGVEKLNITNSENTSFDTLANALALTNVNVTGASTAPVSITTGAIALQTNFAVNAGGLAGNFIFNGTGATTNGFSVVGGSGTNTITGGSQVFSANLSASAAKADSVVLTNATGGTLGLANAKITGFVASIDVLLNDKVTTIGADGAIPANVTTPVATAVASLSAVMSNGVITFSGTGLATATLADKINASVTATLADAANDTVAFEHAGNTYIVTNEGTDTTFLAGTDTVVELVGVTGIVALSTAAPASAGFLQIA